MAKKEAAEKAEVVEDAPVDDVSVETVEVAHDNETVKNDEFPGRILEPQTPVRMPFAEEIEGVKFGYQEAVEPTQEVAEPAE